MSKLGERVGGIREDDEMRWWEVEEGEVGLSLRRGVTVITTPDREPSPVMMETTGNASFSPTNATRRIMFDRILALPFDSTITRTLSMPPPKTLRSGLDLIDYVYATRGDPTNILRWVWASPPSPRDSCRDKI